MDDVIKKCNRCEVQKPITKFYYYTNKTLKSICKWCEIRNISKYKLCYCEDCGLSIRQKNKQRHLNSKRHMRCYFTGETYNSENLQRQNKRHTLSPTLSHNENGRSINCI